MSRTSDLYHSLFPHSTKHKTFTQQSSKPELPTISMDTFQRFKDRLLEHYQKDPKFHTVVDSFHNSVRTGGITFDALFGAVFLAKEIFIANQEDQIYDDIKYRKEKQP